ncbi:CLUMA_CG017604, isoform A [Clunio marinus]|uniref:CLUMA_CG017604, isoform A n=1 Tax=Clunio marinus TaxID=568069 RepID=A0A1J1J102_9DIPT|nr:CLUMA_CG017604, isoform A [Clunio marinus]
MIKHLKCCVKELEMHKYLRMIKITETKCEKFACRQKESFEHLSCEVNSNKINDDSRRFIKDMTYYHLNIANSNQRIDV